MLVTPSHAHVSEVRSLTGLRGVAALWVVLFHYFTPVFLTSPLLCILGHGYLAVDLFFVLSGFVLCLNYSNFFVNGVTGKQYWNFLSRRIARIYPLYFVTLVIATILVVRHLLPFWGMHFTPALLANVFLVQNLGFWQSVDVPAWSISVEWISYLIFPVLMFCIFARKAAVRWGLLLLSLVTIVGLYTWNLNHGGWPKAFDITAGPASIARGLTEFTLGVLSYRALTTPFGQRISRHPWAANGITVLIAILLAFRGSDIFLVFLYPFFILSLLKGSTLVSRILGSRVLEYLGLISFSVYLVHTLLTPFLGWIDAWMRSHGRSHAHTFAVAITLPVLLLLSSLTYYSIEVPARRYLRNVF
jgi:peptidoglycan/LPS O-acetylase OafA/YrhL